MRLEQFRYLLEVNRLHSISAAARKLHINQTTLSAIIQNAEDEVGFPIFQRTPAGVTTTAAGVQFMSLAWEIDEKYDQLLALKQRNIMGIPDIPLILPPIVAGKLTIPLLNLFYAQRIPANLSLIEVPSEDIAERIRNREANLGLGFFPQNYLSRLEYPQGGVPLAIEILREDKLFVMVSEHHPLASLPQVSTTQLYQEHLVAIKRRQNDDMILGSIHQRCRSVTCFSNLNALIAAIRDQRMVGFIPEFAWDAESCAGCTLVPVQDTDHENHLYLCFLTSKRKLRHQEDILAQCIRQCLTPYGKA